MKMTKFKLIVLVGLIVSIIAFWQHSVLKKKRIAENILKIGSEDERSQMEAIDDMFDQPMAYIPVLIDAITINSECNNEWNNPTIGRMSEVKRIPVGVRYAYCIEICVKFERCRPAETATGLVYRSLCNDCYMFFENRIVRSDGKALGQSDMKAVQDVYSAWWRANKNLSLARMRSENAHELILGDGVYRWM